MISSLRLEFGTPRHASLNTRAESKAESRDINSCPVSHRLDSTPTGLVITHHNSTDTGAFDHDDCSEDTKEAQESCAEIKEKISSIGTDENNQPVPSVVAGITSAPNKVASTVGKFSLSIIAHSIKEAYKAFTIFFGPDGDQLARIVFSTISAVSAGMRSLFPVVKEALAALQDSHSVLAVVSLALAAGHVVISLIATLIATKNFPSALFGNDKTEASENKPNEAKEPMDLLLEKIGKKLDALRKNGLVGALGAVREWLMLSSAVVSLLNILPGVIKIVGPIINAPITAIVAGSINLVSAIIELVQGVNEYTSLGEELEVLKAELNKPENAAEFDKLKVKIENKENELSASKVRIGKALIGIFTSVASIVLGVCAIAASISVPVLPAILASISVLTVTVYVVVTIAVRLSRMHKEGELNSSPLSSGDSAEILSTDSDVDEDEEDSQFDNESESESAGPPPIYV